MEGFGFFQDPDFQKRLQEMAEQMQATQSLAWADNAIKLAVDMTVAALVPFTPGGAGVQQALLVKVFAGSATGATVAAYSVGQQIAIAAASFAVGFGAIVFIFRFRSFKEVIAAGREARGAEV